MLRREKSIHPNPAIGYVPFLPLEPLTENLKRPRIIRLTVDTGKRRVKGLGDGLQAVVDGPGDSQGGFGCPNL